jgi:opacity protein-like surface antigen
MPFKRALALGLLVGAITPTAARADTMLIPFIGANFGGNTGRGIARAIDAGHFDWGFGLAYMGSGILGLEADVARSPDFFGRTDIGGSSVLTATGNLLIGIPIGGQKGIGFRPYVVAGLGAIRSRADIGGDAVSVDNTKAAWDAGGGAMLFLATHAGLRFDVRYFRTFGRVNFDVIDAVERSRRLDFGRASLGFIVRF